MMLIDFGFRVDVPKKCVDKSLKTFQAEVLLWILMRAYIIGSNFRVILEQDVGFTSLSTDRPQKEPKHLTENVGLGLHLRRFFDIIDVRYPPQ